MGAQILPDAPSPVVRPATGVGLGTPCDEQVTRAPQNSERPRQFGLERGTYFQALPRAVRHNIAEGGPAGV
jgi:hypothetical protein